MLKQNLPHEWQNFTRVSFATAEFSQTNRKSTKIREKQLLGQNWAKNRKIPNEQVLYQMKLQEVLMTIPTIGHQ